MTDDMPDSLWSTAEFFDRPFRGGITLRAFVCPLGDQWQWSVFSLDGSSGGVISLGVERSAAGARTVALSELAKCFSDPFE